MTETDVFKALADPTRRAIFEKLAAGRMNASALRDGMAISQPAMSQHLAVLRAADGLVPSSGWFVERGALASFDSCSSGVPCPCSHWL